MSEQTPTARPDESTERTPFESLDDEERRNLLSSPARRAVLTVLARNPSTMTLADLASELAATGRNASEDADRHDLEVVLHHNHLPRLAEAGLVEYDPGANSVRPRTDRLSALG
jgi:DNA-binding transcriptional ArsR family regulator